MKNVQVRDWKKMPSLIRHDKLVIIKALRQGSSLTFPKPEALSLKGTKSEYVVPVRQTYRQTENRKMCKQYKTINKEISLHSSGMA
jgi:hypothetical protein